MDTVVTIDLGQVAIGLGLPVDQVRRTVELLDQNNTVPFITRYRKDRTGGFDEEQIRRIRDEVNRQRMLAERKRTILRSIESQGKLTEPLTKLIISAHSIKRLEDLYLPYKPKKQTLATVARERGLQPLADEVLRADPIANDLDARAADFVNPDKGLKSIADVLLGTGHLLAEQFSERADLRGQLRKILRRTGKIVCTQIAPPKTDEPADTTKATDKAKAKPATESKLEGKPAAEKTESEKPVAEKKQVEADTPVKADADANVNVEVKTEANTEAQTPTPTEGKAEETPTVDQSTSITTANNASKEQPTSTTPDHRVLTEEKKTPANDPATAPESKPEIAAKAEDKAQAEAARKESAKAAAEKKKAQLLSKKEQRRAQRAKEKKKEQEQKQKAFKDYFDFQRSLSQLPPHSVLAINRGERARVLRVKIESDAQTMRQKAEELIVPEDHPHADFLKGTVQDTLTRLVVPSLEREARREATEKAERHAVEVFAKNLRKLLLAPPVQNKRVLAVDPGFRNGCKLAALDEFGNVLGHAVIHIVGREERQRQGRARLVDLIRKHNLSVIAIGNGTACRETEQLVADLLANELKGTDVAYVVVNEAGASVYSTSPLSREELPNYGAMLRSAISIGRRLLDPLSELVKINPSNIGVGLYQHDVKAKHLRESLDAVVESCVNYVGVDVNAASPALLRYVSGLNQLSARRLYDYRQEHGPFKNREELHKVPGLGAATFVQAAGFLKINGGDNPLDATWVHPENYEAANRVLEKSGCSIADLASQVPAAKPQPIQPVVEPATTEKKVAPATDAAEQAPATEVVTTETTKVAEAETESKSEKAPEQVTPQPPAEQVVEQSTSEQPTTEQPATEQPTTEQAVTEPPATEEKLVAEQTPAVPTPSPTSEVEQPTPPTAPAVEEQPATASEAKPLHEVKPTTEPTTTESTTAAEPISSPVPKDEKKEKAEKPKTLIPRMTAVDIARLSQELGIGELTLKDILFVLARPGRDPREDLTPPIFRRGIIKLEDLEPGMELVGTVLNVVDFGAFVDIGLHDSGLVHISRLANRYISDPHDVVGVGDTLKVWVVEIDKQRRRVSLTAVQPGTEKPAPARRGRSHKQQGEGEKSSTSTRRGKGRSEGRRSSQEKGRGRPSGRGKFASRPPQTPRRKPKPVAPITKEMEEGAEPMRAFSDLQQFWQKKIDPKDENDAKKQDKKKK